MCAQDGDLMDQPPEHAVLSQAKLPLTTKTQFNKVDEKILVLICP